MKLGIIAGEGNLPLAVARGARLQKIDTVICAVGEKLHPDIGEFAGRIYRVPLHRPSEIVRIFAQEGVGEAVLAGKVWKDVMFRDEHIMEQVSSLLPPGGPRNDDRILLRFVQDLECAGIRVIPQTTYVGDSIVKPGMATLRHPSQRELSDARLGFGVAKHLGGLDIGQTVIVKSGVILAVEAIEGTDAAILRGGKLGGPGAVVVKVSKPAQDPRFDVPVVGCQTLACMKEVGAQCLAVEAGHTIFADRERVLSTADSCGIAIVGLQDTCDGDAEANIGAQHNGHSR